MSYALLAVYGLGGGATSSGLDDMIAPFADNADWVKSVQYWDADDAVDDLKDFSGKIVIICFSMGWRVSKYIQRHLTGKDVFLVSTLDNILSGLHLAAHCIL